MHAPDTDRVYSCCLRITEKIDPQFRPADNRTDASKHKLISDALLTIAGMMNAASAWDGVRAYFLTEDGQPDERGVAALARRILDFLADPARTDAVMVAATRACPHAGCDAQLRQEPRGISHSTKKVNKECKNLVLVRVRVRLG